MNLFAQKEAKNNKRARKLKKARTNFGKGDGINQNTTSFWSVKIYDIVGVMKFGRDWKRIEKDITSRNGSQIRSHAQKYFNKIQQEEKRNKAKKLDIIKNRTEQEK